MTKRSGLDMLQDILQEIKLLRKEVKVMEHNIKMIANSAKISELATKAAGMPSPKFKISSEVAPEKTTISKKNIRFDFTPTDTSKIAQDKAAPMPLMTPELCMCSGKMIAEYKGSPVPLPNLKVTVYDEKDKVVKETKTNRAGVWMGQLPPGKYVANIEGQYAGKDLYPVNLSFVIEKGMKKLEVK